MSLQVRKMRYRRRALPGYRGVSEPTAGDLKFPISIYRSARSPNQNGSFTQTLSCYHNCWAAFDSAPERFLHGENADMTATHLFTVRWDGRMMIEGRDYVQWKNRFYKVGFTKVTGKLSDWLGIFCNEHFEEGTNDNIVIAAAKIETPEDSPSQDNSGWNLPSA